jgi:ribosomal protein L4
MQGFVALAHLSLITNKEPSAKETIEILKGINITKDNKTVFINLSHPVKKILELARLKMAKAQQ